MDGDCPDCKRLSANLTEATKVYFMALGKSAPSQIVKNALEQRRKARLELRHHEATHHYEATMRSGSVSG